MTTVSFKQIISLPRRIYALYELDGEYFLNAVDLLGINQEGQPCFIFFDSDGIWQVPEEAANFVRYIQDEDIDLPLDTALSKKQIESLGITL